MVAELAAYLRDAFGWTGDVVISAGSRGALGQIWRLDTAAASYALKEIFDEPPSEALIQAELALSRRAAAAGVRLPASVAARDRRYLLTAPGGGWLRLYEWVDLRPVDRGAAATPARLGSLLARLHRCAPGAAGGGVSAWYERVPARHEWVTALESGASWAPVLADRLTTLTELCTHVAAAEPAQLITCHRDLHPENVLAGPGGELVVVDWDNLGPAAPQRELAQALFDWFGDRSAIDLAAMRAMYEAYLRGGGPGRITHPADFTMLLASRLNFLLLQTRRALDPDIESRHHDWARREIAEALDLLPTPGQLDDALALLAPLARS